MNWTAAGNLLSPESSIFLALVIVLMPILAFLSHRRLESGKPLLPKTRRYRFAIGFQLLIAYCAVQFATAHNIQLFPAKLPNTFELGIGALLVAAGWIGQRRGWPRLTEQRRRRAYLLLPENGFELRRRILISMMAGFCEEIAYRGALFSFLRLLLGSTASALMIAVMVFAIAHVSQGLRAILGVSILALFFHLLVFVSGTLYVAMLAHAAYDLVVGVMAVQFATPTTSEQAQVAAAT